MVSPIITHVIGITALLAILTIIIIYTGFMTQVVMYNNIKNNLEYVSQMIAMQIKYGIYSDTNTTLTLDYPVVVGNNVYYNVYIGNGTVLANVFPILSDKLESTGLYVITATPSNDIYAYTYVCNTTYAGKEIVVVNGYILFGSGSIAKITINTTTTSITISIKEILVRTP